jgi:hypothetical protein
MAPRALVAALDAADAALEAAAVVAVRTAPARARRCSPERESRASRGGTPSLLGDAGAEPRKEALRVPSSESGRERAGRAVRANDGPPEVTVAVAPAVDADGAVDTSAAPAAAVDNAAAPAEGRGGSRGAARRWSAAGAPDADAMLRAASACVRATHTARMGCSTGQTLDAGDGRLLRRGGCSGGCGGEKQGAKGAGAAKTRALAKHTARMAQVAQAPPRSFFSTITAAAHHGLLLRPCHCSSSTAARRRAHRCAPLRCARVLCVQGVRAPREQSATRRATRIGADSSCRTGGQPRGAS